MITCHREKEILFAILGKSSSYFLLPYIFEANNNISSIPTEIGLLTNLEKLYMGKNSHFMQIAHEKMNEISYE